MSFFLIKRDDQNPNYSSFFTNRFAIGKEWILWGEGAHLRVVSKHYEWSLHPHMGKPHDGEFLKLKRNINSGVRYKES